MSIGPEQLGEFAQSQLEAARRDPRADRARGAMVADFQDAMEEAERIRELGVWGLYELQRSLDREEADCGVSREDPGIGQSQARKLQAAWERSEMARAEIENEYPHLHATALISMHSALDALVEELAPKAQEMVTRWTAEQALERIMEGLDEEQRRAWDKRGEELRTKFLTAWKVVLTGRMGTPGRPKGAGTDRYETVLAKAGLRAPRDRPLPEDLCEALAELGALRDVLVHRAGRIDEIAIKDAPSLTQRYREGDFVRLNRADYRRYSASVRAYGAEIIRRFFGRLAPDVDLANWTRWHRINA